MEWVAMQEKGSVEINIVLAALIVEASLDEVGHWVAFGLELQLFFQLFQFLGRFTLPFGDLLAPVDSVVFP